MSAPHDIANSHHRVLILGNTRTAEMRPIMDAAVTCFGDGELRCVPSVLQLDEQIVADWSPGLIIVCQNWPDEFQRSEILRLIARFPQSRWVCCFGLWCESDGRNRDLWPLGTRIPARMAAVRLSEERRVQVESVESLPLTAGRDEAFEFDYRDSESGTHALRNFFAAALSPDRELRRLWEDVLQSAGLALVGDACEELPDVILWDADPWDRDRREHLRELRRQFEDARIIALMNFARPEDVHGITRHGADAVVSKLAGNRSIHDAVEAPALHDALAVIS